MSQFYKQILRKGQIIKSSFFKYTLLFISIFLLTACSKQEVETKTTTYKLDNKNLSFKKVYYFKDTITPYEINKNSILDNLSLLLKEKFEVEGIQQNKDTAKLFLYKRVDINCDETPCDKNFIKLKKIYLTLDIKLISPKADILGIYGKINNSYSVENNEEIPKLQLNMLQKELKAIFKKVSNELLKVERKHIIKEEKLSEKMMWLIYKDLNSFFKEKIIYIKKSPRKISTNIISTNYIILGDSIKFTLYPSNEGTKIYYSGTINYYCSSDGYCSLGKKDIEKVKKQIETSIQKTTE